MRLRLSLLPTLVSVLSIAIVAAACSSDSVPAAAPAPQSPATTQPTSTATAPPTPEPSATATVTATAPVQSAPASPSGSNVRSDIKGFVLEELVVAVGTEVTWTNRDAAPHTSTSGSQGARTGLWDSEVLRQGDAFSLTFDEAGTFQYFCTVHPSSMNTVTVVDADQPASAQPSPTAEPPAATLDLPTPTPIPPTATAVPPAAAPEVATPTPEPQAATPSPTATPEPTATPMPTATSAPAPEMVGSNIVDFALENLTIPAGSTVTWTNLDTAPHTSTAGSPGSLSGQWDSSTLQTDGTFSFTFDQVGVFQYFCTIHPFMTATVTVVAAGAEPEDEVASQATATPNQDDGY